MSEMSAKRSVLLRCLSEFLQVLPQRSEDVLLEPDGYPGAGLVIMLLRGGQGRVPQDPRDDAHMLRALASKAFGSRASRLSGSSGAGSVTNHDPRGHSVVTLALVWPPLLVEDRKCRSAPERGRADRATPASGSNVRATDGHGSGENCIFHCKRGRCVLRSEHSPTKTARTRMACDLAPLNALSLS